MIERLHWDSVFFNLCVGQLNAEEYSESLDFSEYDLLYVLSSGDFDLKLKGFINSFSEQKVNFCKELKETEILSSNIFSFDESKHSILEIYRLAYESGKHSRFLLDKNFGFQKFMEMYRVWIDNSIKKDFADEVLVYLHEGKEVGLLTYKTRSESASVGLIAVSPQIQGKGVGRTMLMHLETLLFKKGVKRLNIPTQLENKQACSFYERQDYQISDIKHIKHYWKINDTI